MKTQTLFFTLAAVLAALIFTSAPAERAAALPSAAERRVDSDPYSLINAVNNLRIANGLAPYAANSILMTVAQQHAQFMAANGVTHYGVGGSSPWQRGLAAGYPLAGDLNRGGFYSENIIAGSEMSAQEAVDAWQGDAPHLHTMLSADLQEIGAGVVVAGDYVYYVIDCARPNNSGQVPAFTPQAGATASTGGGGGGQIVVNTIVPATPDENGKITHVVKPGETLWLIAVSYGKKVNDLRLLNQLAEGQSIHPGQILVIGLAPTYTPLPPTETGTALPTSTPSPSQTPTALPPTPTPTPPPSAPISSGSNLLVMGVIILAAVALAAVFVRAGQKD